MYDLTKWQSFYLVVGGTAGALIGLQFVVMTLIADRPFTKERAAAFTTPTVIYFATALLLSALASIPWPRISLLAIAWGIVGFAGCAHGINVARLMRNQDVHALVLVDWLFNLLLPLLSYLTLVIAAVAAIREPTVSVWATAVVSLILLFSGVRNSWGIISYHVLNKPASGDKVLK